MTINKAQHKKFLFFLFYPKAKGVREERSFPLIDLIDAASALKKLRENGEEVLENGNLVAYRWSDSLIEFSVSESKILQGLVNQIKEAAPSESEVIIELKELLK